MLNRTVVDRAWVGVRVRVMVRVIVRVVVELDMTMVNRSCHVLGA